MGTYQGKGIGRDNASALKGMPLTRCIAPVYPGHKLLTRTYLIKRFVSGHGFSRAIRVKYNLGFSP